MLLHETTVGLPDRERIISSGIIQKGTQVNQGTPGDYTNNPPKYNRIELTNKVKLEEGKTYAFSIGAPFETHSRLTTSNDVNWTVSVGQDGVRLKLRSAKLGEFGPNPGANNIITNKQTYIEGVMLSSSNRTTWTTHQDEDLTFRISECLFNPGPKNVSFNTSTKPFSNVTDIILQMGIETPGETVIDYNINHGSSLENLINIVNGEHKILDTKINSITSHQLQASLKTEETVDVNGYVSETPSLFNTSSIFFGTVSPLSVYVTKNIDLTNGRPFSTPKKLITYIDVEGNFDSSRLKVFYTTDKIIGDASWNSMDLDTTYEGPAIEKRYVLNSSDLEETINTIGSFLRIKMVIETDINNPLEYSKRMGIHNLRVFSK